MSSSLQMGIVGLPNVGKSTLFNLLTHAGAASENYPFCTIDPNVGVVPVPDHRLTEIANLVDPKQTIPTSMNFVDIAGLVEGASKGEGLGNQFLSNIRDTHAIAHVVRCHHDSDVVHVAGRVDPVADCQVIQTELALADLESVERAQLKATKLAKSGDKEAKQNMADCAELLAHLGNGVALRVVSLSESALALAHRLRLLTIKPMLYIANVSENKEDSLLQLNALQQHAMSEQNTLVIPVCAKIEEEIAALSAEDVRLFLEELGWDEPGLNRIIRASYALLGLQTFFTAGPQEVRAWTFRQGASAVEAAGVIHTDFMKHFIRAEIMAYADFIEHQGEAGAKAAGVWRLEGKDYVVADGDIIYFRTSA